LKGDWVLLGGALVAVWLSAKRRTEDVDLAGPGKRADERLQLMRLARELELPVEAVNTAADFFLHQVKGWRRHLVLLQEGRTARIFRPDATLFLILKARRMSQRDLDDCRLLLKRSSARSELDPARVRAAIAEMPAPEPAVKRRRGVLLAALDLAVPRARRGR
jgi:hypothetical protein